VYENFPRTFFFFLPVFALFLKLLYRKQGYLMFLAGQWGRYLPGPVRPIVALMPSRSSPLACSTPSPYSPRCLSSSAPL
jgi:hypothetical protein